MKADKIFFEKRYLGECPHCHKPQYDIIVNGEVAKQIRCTHPEPTEAKLLYNFYYDEYICENCHVRYTHNVIREAGIYTPARRLTLHEILFMTALRVHEVNTSRRHLTPPPDTSAKFGKCLNCEVQFTELIK